MTSARHCPGAFKKAKQDLKKLKVSPMSAIGIGILRRARSSGPTRPIEYSGSNRKNALWILKRLAGWSTPMTEALYSTVDEEVAVGVHPVHQHRIVRPSGEVRNVQSITSKLWKTMDVGPENGIPREHNRLFGTVQDITELKRAEEASHALSRDLQESKDWLEEAQRVAHLGYWVWDLETNQVIWS